MLGQGPPRQRVTLVRGQVVTLELTTQDACAGVAVLALDDGTGAVLVDSRSAATDGRGCCRFAVSCSEQHDPAISSSLFALIASGYEPVLVEIVCGPGLHPDPGGVPHTMSLSMRPVSPVAGPAPS